MDKTSKKYFITLVISLVLVLGLAACSSTESSDQEGAQAKLEELRAAGDYKEVTIKIGDNYFEPQITEIEPGTIVIWEHQGRIMHDVVWDDRTSASTSAQDDFTSARLTNGDIHVWLFEEEGTYNYHCRYHGGPQRGHWGAIKVSSTDRSPSEQD